METQRSVAQNLPCLSHIASSKPDPTLSLLPRQPQNVLISGKCEIWVPYGPPEVSSRKEDVDEVWLWCEELCICLLSIKVTYFASNL